MKKFDKDKVLEMKNQIKIKLAWDGGLDYFSGSDVDKMHTFLRLLDSALNKMEDSAKAEFSKKMLDEFKEILKIQPADEPSTPDMALKNLRDWREGKCPWCGNIHFPDFFCPVYHF